MEKYPFPQLDISTSFGEIPIFRHTPKIVDHRHVNFELVYVLQGTAIRKIANAEMPIAAGDFYLNPPLHVHGHADVKDAKILNCYFAPAFLDRIFPNDPSVWSVLSNQADATADQAKPSIIDHIFHDTDGTIRQLLLNMEKEYTNRDFGYIELLRSYLTPVLIHIYRALGSRPSCPMVTQITNYLKEHYAQPLSLNVLSQLVGYTPQYISKRFSHEVGMSIQTFLQRFRIEQACFLLLDTDMSTAEVAEAVGYHDTQHFSKLFHKYLNMSPKEYRKRI